MPTTNPRYTREQIGPDAYVFRNWVLPHKTTREDEEVEGGKIYQGVRGDDCVAVGATPPLSLSPSRDSEWIQCVREHVLPFSPFRHMLRRRGGGSGSGKSVGREGCGSGAPLSVAMTNCGEYGWVSDAVNGYGYSRFDPINEGVGIISVGAGVVNDGKELKGRWPKMPCLFATQASSLAEAAGFPNYTPDCCLINSYRIGARLAPHRDTDEEDLLTAPIVSVSLGLSCVFLWGGGAAGLSREAVPAAAPAFFSVADTSSLASNCSDLRRIVLNSGDAVVWGGASRLAPHGVMPIAAVKKDAYRYKLLDGTRWNFTFRMVKGFYKR